MKRMTTFLLVLCLAASGAFAQNMINDGDFEVGGSDWATGNGMGIVTSDAANALVGDSYAFHDSTIGGGWQTSYASQTINASNYATSDVITAVGWIAVDHFVDFGNPVSSRALLKFEKINWGGVGATTDLNAEDWFNVTTTGYVPTCISIAVPDTTANTNPLNVVGAVGGEQNGTSATMRMDYITVVKDTTGLVNPGFETGDFGGWAPTSFGNSLTAAVANDGWSGTFDNHYGYGNGSCSFKIEGTTTAGGFWGNFIEQPVVVPAGSNVVIRADVKITDLVTTDTGGGWGPVLTMKFEENAVLTAGQELIPPVNTATLPNVAGWANLRGTGTATGAGPQKIVVGLFAENKQVSGNIWIDNVSFAILPDQPPSEVHDWRYY